ncbi:hypothetical protein SLS60_002489 [Paraconiothyrium brasiliense]|uniref:Uncharacterized protein n=1 Tax=Paraconiothyrium brasiliense TaxID=300254 RepID=A0ABR3S2U5_9PLEO
MEIPRTSGDYPSEETLSNERIQRIITSASKKDLEADPTDVVRNDGKLGQPNQDLEKASAATDAESETEAWVTWDGPDDPANPRNWSAGRKWLVTFVTSSFSFIAPLSSSMISPALPAISDELQINNALGPIMAGFIVKYANWRWCFYSVSIGDVFVQVISSLLLQETYPRVVLARKAKALRKKTGDSSLMTEWEAEGQSLAHKLRTAFKRPVKLITTQPIIQFVAIYMAFLYGLIYLVLSTFPRLWTVKYHEEVHIGGLNYIAVGLGFLTGSQVGTRLQDRIYMALKRGNGGVGRPEFRVPLMVPGSILLPIGIFVYAWTAEVTAFWLWPNVGMYIICGSMILCWQAMQAYLVEAYTTYSASALAAATVLRSLAATGFPLFVSESAETLQ